MFSIEFTIKPFQCGYGSFGVKVGERCRGVDTAVLVGGLSLARKTLLSPGHPGSAQSLAPNVEHRFGDGKE